MKQLFFALALVMAVSCTSKKGGETSQTVDSTAPTTPKTEYLSYVGSIKRDTVKLELERTGDNFKGFLFYKLRNAENSQGEYKGTISGDTLKGVYRFMSKGFVSNIDKYFLLKNNKLLEGSGAFVMVDDTTLTFRENERVIFGDSYVLSPVEYSPTLIPQTEKDVYYGQNQ